MQSGRVSTILDSAAPEAAPKHAGGELARRLGVLAFPLFCLTLMINIMDRQLMAILAEPIRRELGLSDAQLGFLNGFGFAVFYAALGIPIAAWADRRNRVRLLAFTSVLSSTFTGLCGLASSFLMLAASRVGVAVGDAGGAPTMHSLLSDAVPAERRAKTLANLQLAVPVGGVLAYAGGGAIAESFGWRWAFLAVAGPGILIGLLTLWLVREPRRTMQDHDSSLSIAAVKASLRDLLAARAFCWALPSVACAGACMYALGAWAPSVLQRSHGWTTAEAGLAVGLATGIGGLVGTWAGGALTDALRRRGNAGAEFRVPQLAVAIGGPLALAGALSPDGTIAFAFFAAATAFFLAWNAPSIAGCQNIAHGKSRALASSLHVFSVNMFGLGLGPLAVGVASDLLRPSLGEQALGYALGGFVIATSVIGTIAFQRAARHARDEGARASASEPAN